MAKSPLGVRVTTEIESENTIERRFRSTLAKVKTNLNKTPIQLKATIDATTTANAVNKIINSRAFKNQLGKIQLKTSIDTSQLSKQVQQVLKAITLVAGGGSGNGKGSNGNSIVSQINELIKKTRELEGYKRQLETAKANPNANSSYIAQLNNQITTLETNIKSLKTAINASGQSVDPTFNIDTYKQYSDVVDELGRKLSVTEGKARDTESALKDTAGKEAAVKSVNDYVNALQRVSDLETKIAQEEANGNYNNGYIEELRDQLSKAQDELTKFGDVLYGNGTNNSGMIANNLIPKEQLDYLKQAISEIINQYNLLANKFDTQHKESISDALESITNYELKARAALTRFYSQYGRAGIDTSGVDSAKSDLFQTINDGSMVADEKLKKLIEDFQRLSSEIAKATAEAQAQNTGLKDIKGFDSLSAKLDRWIEKNKRIKDSSIWPEVQKLQVAVRTYTGTLEENQAAFARLDAEANKLGLTVETLGGKITRLWKEHFQTAAVMAGIHLVQQGLRGIYQNVIEIDSAMTELKKVTNETDDTYSQFLDNAGERAQRYGSTITDIVNATADAARLGLNLEDASSLADASVVYKNVGDGIESISDASESVISTMKAFGIEASNAMTIVDKFNEVGKIVA